MIDLVAYYAKRNDKALEDGDKRLAVRYARLEEAERASCPIAKARCCPPASHSSASMRAGSSPSAATAGASSTRSGTSARGAGCTSWIAGTSPSSATSMLDARGASSKIGRRLSKDK